MKIGIIGCGVAGMAAAILLSRAGHRVTVLERFAEPRPLGAGLLLQPTGLAVLERLGLAHAARKAGAPIDGIRGFTVGGRKVLDLSYSDLAPGCAGLGIHRAVLFDLLFQALAASSAQLICGAEIVDLVSNDDDVSARDSAGNLHGPFDAVLVCDGAHSKLRAKHAALRADPVYPWACVWATLPDPEQRFAGWLHQRFGSTTTMIGILPIGQDPICAGSAVTLFWSLPCAQLEAWPQQGFAAWRDEVAALWPELAPLLSSLNGPQDFSHASYRDVSLRRWRQGRVLFLGDCCHGTSPQLGQGANLALLDAWVLARELAKGHDVAVALDRVAALRRGQVDFYRQASRWLTPFYQSYCRPFGWLRDLTFALACRWRPARHLMLTTLAGLRRGWWRSQRLNGRGGFDLDGL